MGCVGSKQPAPEKTQSDATHCEDRGAQQAGNDDIVHVNAEDHNDNDNGTDHNVDANANKEQSPPGCSDPLPSPNQPTQTTTTEN